MKYPVRRIDGRVSCYESEIPERVESAFNVFFPKKTIKTTTVDAGYGTKVRLFTAKIEKKQAKELFEKIKKSMSSEEIDNLLKKIGKSEDKKRKIYLRFDKQIAYSKEKIKHISEEDGSIQIVLSLDTLPANIFKP